MTNLEQILVTHLNAQRIPIDQITSSCCKPSDSVMPIIDFDAVKIFFCSKRGIRLPWQLKSADCLHIDISKKAVCFVEMKDTDEYFANAPEYDNADDYKQAFDEWLEEQTESLVRKIIDSIFIITAAAGKYSPNTNDTALLLSKRDTKISYVVLTNMNNSDYTLYNLASLEAKIRYPLLTGPLHQAVTVITSDFAAHIATKL